LQEFYCGYNKITQIPNTLPNSLQIFICTDNKITQIPNTLPNFLQEFYCSFNQITKIPDLLPDSLQKFTCGYSQITQIPLSIIQQQKLNFFRCWNENIFKPPLVIYFSDNLDSENIKQYCYNLIWKVRVEF